MQGVHDVGHAGGAAINLDPMARLGSGCRRHQRVRVVHRLRLCRLGLEALLGRGRARRAGAQRPIGGEHSHHVAVELVRCRYGGVLRPAAVPLSLAVGRSATAAARAMAVVVVLLLVPLLCVAEGGGGTHRVRRAPHFTRVL